MRALDFNDGWAYRHLNERDEPFRPVSIPHDAMLAEPRTPKAATGRNGGWFEGRDYEYIKRFDLDGVLGGRPVSQCALVLEFEGVWHDAEVWVNGRKAAYRPYGYTNFYVGITSFVHAGGGNEVRVVARNSDQPNSRWYTGAGIHRPVRLWVAPRQHVLVNGVCVRTLSVGGAEGSGHADASGSARIEVQVDATAAGRAHIEITRDVTEGDGGAASAGANSGVEGATDGAPAVVAQDDIPLAPHASADTSVDVDVDVAAAKTTASVARRADAQAAAVDATSTATGTGVLRIPAAHLWSPETPSLYRCTVRYEAESGERDEFRTSFGIRSLSWGGKGLLINGRRTLLLGACVHSDNGILGARALPQAEERKVRLLKAQGYNAIRSSHNPCSKALLQACDRLGMLVVDEYIDQWYIHKTPHDYVAHFRDWWKSDLTDMALKDRNHPSVIMYSTGNEVSETAERKGIKLTAAMTDHLHRLDPTRPVTCGVNIFFNLLSRLGFGQYSDKKAQREAESVRRRAGSDASNTPNGSAARRVANRLPLAVRAVQHKSVGSEFFNEMAGIMGADFMKKGAALPMCDAVTRDAFAAMDIAGYNYGIERYERDLKAYPDRLIMGTETFCSDAYRFRELAERNPRLIGDFVWAGMDYLGEAGVGAWEYTDYAPAHQEFGWLTAGSGRLDLNGRALGEALYTRVALAGETGPYIAVRPVNHTDEKHSPSAWKMSDAIASWSWNGCEGRLADVEVYARAAEVSLVLNGRELACKRIFPQDGCVARFRIPYVPGVLEAVAWDAQGHELARCSLKSAGGETMLQVRPEKGFESILPGSIAYVDVRYTDSHGTVKPLERGRLRAQVSGGELLAFGSAAPFNTGRFDTGESDTYFGEALAVVQAPADARPGVESPSVVRLSVTDGSRTARRALAVQV